MEEILNCPVCHVQIRPTDFFCSNCGKNLKAKPPSLSFGPVALLYVGSFLLPPLGFLWGYKYVKSPDATLKIVGFVAMALTTASLIATTMYTMNFVNKINEQVTKQMQSVEGF